MFPYKIAIKIAVKYATNICNHLYLRVFQIPIKKTTKFKATLYRGAQLKWQILLKFRKLTSQIISYEERKREKKWEIK